MSCSYKVWVKLDPGSFAIIHTWRPHPEATIRQRAKDRYFPNAELAHIEVKKLGK